MTMVTLQVSKLLAEEVSKDLEYEEIYQLAQEALSRRFLRKYNLEALCEEFGERYDYVFLMNEIDPLQIQSK